MNAAHTTAQLDASTGLRSGYSAALDINTMGALAQDIAQGLPERLTYYYIGQITALKAAQRVDLMRDMMKRLLAEPLLAGGNAR